MHGYFSSILTQSNAAHVLHTTHIGRMWEAEKDPLSLTLQRICELLSLSSSQLMDNGTLLHKRINTVEWEIAGLPRDMPEESTGQLYDEDSGKIYS